MLKISTNLTNHLEGSLVEKWVEGLDRCTPGGKWTGNEHMNTQVAARQREVQVKATVKQC